ncbi:2OG-Fe dioxygenase family protein [Pseudomonas reactans]|uniref:2OG-Fe dioxygenase family protein n=1 Tax=Pseudomonas reactans TaxID=117680 RepID=UPI00159FCC11|nr:2OG-Fe dioxygenase family protein [Pseudomonas reactans]NWC87465.1 2OG-Fe dioxygenase family protein [Pseudomonas reactans]NWD32736.1 2OG-Fe dioxygenase family protein [Pseudomonas reactans]NWF16596.1 2OG-Fe dioxygenase family protein [Pseudomonas reactans]
MSRPVLAEDGYEHYMSRVSQSYRLEDLAGLRQEFGRLEQDEYAPVGVRRFRRYGNGVILPWEDKTSHWLPAVEDKAGGWRAGYDQGSNNPDHLSVRYFHALSESVKSNAILRALIEEDFSLTFWSCDGQQLPVYFGVHFVKLTSSGPSDPGISSPNFFHQDGEPFTFAHLIYRSKHMMGGENFIATTGIRNTRLEDAPIDQILARFTLSSTFESFVVHDPKVSHYVSPIIKCDEAREEITERCIILIDFSSTAQRL